MNLKSNLINSTLLLVGCLIALTIGEVGLRYFKPQIVFVDFPSGWWLPEKDLCHVHAPHLKSYYETNEFRVDFTTNSLGLRDREVAEKDDSIFRILSVGDSFTWGGGVAQNETYPKHLETLLNSTGSRYEVINAGVSSYDTRQEFYYLLKYGLKLKPDLVLLGFVPNDITRDEECILMVNSDGDLVDKNRVTVRVPRSKGMRIPEPFSWRLFLQLNSHFYVLCDKLFKKVFGVSSDSVLMEKVYLKQENMTVGVQKAYYHTLDYLGKIKSLCDAEGIKLVVVGIPMPEQMNSNSYLGPKHDMRQPFVILEQWATAFGVDYLNPLERFRHVSKKNTLYWPHDGHMNGDGYHLLAEEIFAFMNERKLLTK